EQSPTPLRPPPAPQPLEPLPTPPLPESLPAPPLPEPLPAPQLRGPRPAVQPPEPQRAPPAQPAACAGGLVGQGSSLLRVRRSRPTQAQQPVRAGPERWHDGPGADVSASRRQSPPGPPQVRAEYQG